MGIDLQGFPVSYAGFGFAVYATGCFVTFLCDISMYIEKRLQYKEIILLSSSRAFSLSTPMEYSAFCQF